MCYYLYVGNPSYLSFNDFHNIHPGFLCLIFVTLKKNYFLNNLLCFQILCIWIISKLVLVSDVPNLICILKSLSTSPVPQNMLQAVRTPCKPHKLLHQKLELKEWGDHKNMIDLRVCLNNNGNIIYYKGQMDLIMVVLKWSLKIK